MKGAVLAALLALAACGGHAPAPQVQHTGDLGTVDTDADRRQRLIADLAEDLRNSYDRDAEGDVDTERIDPRVGPVRISVGPSDIQAGFDVRVHPLVRWPLVVAEGTPTAVRSKHLSVHLASDRGVSGAWVSDELSWRVTFCGRTAAIPLRFTALYARDGDRWVDVVEHISFGDEPHATPELVGGVVQSAESSRALTHELAGTLAPLLARQTDRFASVLARDPNRLDDDVTRPAPSFLLGPGADAEWTGADDLARAALLDGTLEPEDRRVGYVGASEATATLAYWAGNFVATLPDRPGAKGGRARLRGTFVFEKRPQCKDGVCPPAGTVDCASDASCHWVIVQGHVSQPIDDYELAQRVFGTALLSIDPVQLTCDDGSTPAGSAAP